MAAFVRTSFTNNYINRPVDAREWLYEAFSTGTEASRKSLQHLLRNPDFIIEGTTDSNTAVLSTGAPQSYLMNLTTEGVTVPTGYDRDIDIIAWTRDETGPNYQYFRQTIRGGTDPTLVGGVRNLGTLVGGRLTFATAAATAADSFGGFSVTGAATATGRYAIALPKARRVIVDSMHVTHVGTGDLSSVAHTFHLNALTLATGVGEVGFRDGLDANVAPPDTVQASLLFDVLPVESPELVIATSTDPDQVLVGALGQANENVSWLVHVYVGPLRSNSATANSD